MLNIISFFTDSYFLSISNLGSGSDFAPFMYRIGVPAVDMGYAYDNVSNAAFRLACRSPHCHFDGDISKTAQAPLAAEERPSHEKRQANQSITSRAATL